MCINLRGNSDYDSHAHHHRPGDCEQLASERETGAALCRRVRGASWESESVSDNYGIRHEPVFEAFEERELVTRDPLEL